MRGKTKDKKIIVMLLSSIAAILIVGVIIFTTFFIHNGTKENEVVDRGTEISDTKLITLDNYSGNITITKSGQYIISGTMEHTLIVDADAEVTLILDGITLSSSTTAAIINLNDNDLILALMSEKMNQISGGSLKKYDAAIWSNGKIIIEGEGGALTVQNSRKDGDPISAFEIKLHSGSLILTGMKNFSLDNYNFDKKYVSFMLDEEIEADETVTVTNAVSDSVNQIEILSKFKKLVLFSDDLKNNQKYYLYGDYDLIKSAEVNNG